MLQRSTQIGEFYRMSAPTVWNTREPLPPTYMGARCPHARARARALPQPTPVADIVVYDEERDQHVHIPFHEAFYAAGAGDRSMLSDGGNWTAKYDRFKMSDPMHIPAGVVAQFMSQASAFRVPGVADVLPHEEPFKTSTGGDGTPGSHFLATILSNDADEAKNFLHQVLWLDLFESRVNDPDAGAKAVIDMIHYGIWLPIEIVIARPFIEHMAMSAIMTVSGRDTGATLFGPAGSPGPNGVMCSPQIAARWSDPASRLQTCRFPPTPPSRPSKGALLNFGLRPKSRFSESSYS